MNTGEGDVYNFELYVPVAQECWPCPWLDSCLNSENSAELSGWRDVLHKCHREYKNNKLKSELNIMRIK